MDRTRASPCWTHTDTPRRGCKGFAGRHRLVVIVRPTRQRQVFAPRGIGRISSSEPKLLRLVSALIRVPVLIYGALYCGRNKSRRRADPSQSRDMNASASFCVRAHRRARAHARTGRKRSVVPRRREASRARRKSGGPRSPFLSWYPTRFVVPNRLVLMTPGCHIDVHVDRLGTGPVWKPRMGGSQEEEEVAQSRRSSAADLSTNLALCTGTNALS
ncbi:hypothetical protein MRX96_019344 [Rhipicephalus microplus]